MYFAFKTYPGGGAFALFFHPHPREFATQNKKSANARGLARGGGGGMGAAGIDWCITLASWKQFISRHALRKHCFQCRLANQHLIPAKQRDFSTFYTKARGQQSSRTSSKTRNKTFNCRFEEEIHGDVSTLVLIPRAIKI